MEAKRRKANGPRKRVVEEKKKIGPVRAQKGKKACRFGRNCPLRRREKPTVNPTGTSKTGGSSRPIGEGWKRAECRREKKVPPQIVPSSVV